MTSRLSILCSRLAISMFLAGAAATHAPAQQTTQDQQVPDQPDPEDRNHGVARISLMNGDVSVRRGDSGDFVAAQINAPLLAADSIQTGPASRAEVQFDYANRIRISSGAEVRMGDLRDGAFQVQIARGISTLSILRDSTAQIEISTPSASLHPTRRGEYRVTVLDDGTTQITVRAGDLEIYTPRGSQRIATGQTMLVRGSADDPEYQVIAAIGRDDWDTFNERRDRELLSSNAYQHVSTDIQGAEDLDQYGKWQQDPTYGTVWTPAVSSDWAPYQGGRWVWGDYYGWTWVSTDPWGWAPYHYGNWFYGASGWSWYPGSYRGRYWYRPALVGFFGFGAGAGFGYGFGFGNIGWVPLAPFERCHPWWGRYGGGYGRGISNINIVNNTNIYNNYRNARGPNGISSVTSQQFQAGQFGRVAHPTTGQVQNAGLVRGQLPVTPNSANLRFNDRTTGVTRQASLGQQFVSRGGFSQVQRTPFEQQRQNVQNSFSAPRGGQQMNGAGQGGRTFNSAPSQNPGNGGSSSWQRFGSPAGGTTSSIQVPSRNPQTGSGWRQFGAPESGSAPQFNQSPRSNFNGNGAGNSPSTGRSVQIAPPIVQPRAPQYSSPSGNQGNYRPPTPSNREPAGNQGNYRPPAPTYRQPAPSSGGGRQSAPAAPARPSGGSSGGGHPPNNGGRR